MRDRLKPVQLVIDGLPAHKKQACANTLNTWGKIDVALPAGIREWPKAGGKSVRERVDCLPRLPETHMRISIQTCIEGEGVQPSKVITSE